MANGPKGIFGERQVVQDTPVVQLTAAYLTTGQLDLFTQGNGTAGARDSKFFATSGTDSDSFSSVISKRPLIYKAGQGAKFRGTARFVNPQPDSLSFVGLLNVENRIGFAYVGDIFGILYQRNGAPEIQELQVTTPAAGSETATITLEGNSFSVPLTATTVELNAIEIEVSLNTQQELYDFKATGDIVIGRRILSGPSVGAFAFSSATAVAVWTEIVAGKAFTTDFIPKSQWNRKPNRTVNTDNLMPYQIRFQYLGGGIIDFAVENGDTGEFDIVHTIEIPGTEELPSISNPSFRAGIIAVNLGNTQSIEIESASIGTFIEGDIVLTREGRAATHNALGIGLLPTSILSIRNRLVFDGKVAETEIRPTLIVNETDSLKPVEVTVFKNATTTVPLIYNFLDEDNSIAEISTDQQTVTGGEVLFSSAGGIVDLTTAFRSLLPGESATIAMNITQAPASAMLASLNWQEDFA